MEEKELCLNGFCRSQNQGRMVLSVLINEGRGWTLDEVDCGYGVCPHKEACEIAKQIDEALKES